MEDLKSLTMDALVDLLSTPTSAYIQLHESGVSKGHCKKPQAYVDAIQAEIKLRRKNVPVPDLKSKPKE